VLSLGVKDDAVTLVQTILSKYYSSSLGNTFGSQTEYAVRIFQKETALNMDGKIGEKTWQAFAKISGCSDSIVFDRQMI
jgi:peptidoglycan hydrolase-like protein with peptidoglycan-binding domain